jgi:hypothetical protein
MKFSKSILITCVAIATLLVAFAQDKPRQLEYEYVTIRWAGKENTHLVRPGGKVEFIGNELRKLPRPDRTDDRAFYMNAALNGLAKEGYELAATTSDEIIMKRQR